MSNEKKNSIDVDVEKVYAEAASSHTVSSPEDAQRAKRKIDFILLPILAFCYFLQFLDKQSLSYASLLGMIEDTGFHGSQFSWTASIFYFGYIAASYPCAFLSVRLPIGKYLSGTVLLWACALLCHAAAKNYGGLLATRFFLGAFEAGVAPGFALITPMYYTRREQPLRFGLWFCSNGIATTLGGLIAYGIGYIRGPMASWHYLFLIFGAITAVWGVVMLFILSDSPSKARWLSPTERVGSILATVVQNLRTISMICLTCISLHGMVLMYALDPSNQAGRLGGFCLSLAFAANMPLSLSLVASNVGGFTKRAVVNASVLIAYCAGNIAGPQFFSVDEAPNYPRGIKACLAGFCLGVFWLVCLFVYLVWENRRRARNTDVDLDAPVSREVLLEDKTDREIPRRYVL